MTFQRVNTVEIEGVSESARDECSAWRRFVTKSAAWVVKLVLLLVVTAATADAGLFKFRSRCGESPCSESECSRPVIVRPCRPKVFSYQRLRMMFQSCCGEASCAAPSRCDPSCCAPAPCLPECGTACANAGTSGCSEVDSDIAYYIHESQTACYASDRREAIHYLSDRYDCCCYPHVMNALIYALNDTDERVRSKAADEIGDQIRRNRCRVGPPVIRALQCALGDCDAGVRRQAEEALMLSGYDIMDGCCQPAYCSATCSDAASVPKPGPVDVEAPHTPEQGTELPPVEVPPAAVPPAEVVPADVPTVTESPILPTLEFDIPEHRPVSSSVLIPAADESEEVSHAADEDAAPEYFPARLSHLRKSK